MQSTNQNLGSNGTAVFIKNLCKRFDGVEIIKDLNMNVKEGSVYCLLGASGCGKTTLLSCIVGVEKWKSGELLVFGKTPGSKYSEIPGKGVGYMPQDVALYEDLTIVEMMEYYGKIFDMSNTEFIEKKKGLIQLLNLPNQGSDLIRNLSGGQKRRASMALALIHSPKLLVLDEPTVGLDPVLRMTIWNYLVDLVKCNGSTVIITTHYMDEARFSDMIGIMRNSEILVEETRSKLEEKYNSLDLERIALEICRKDEQFRKNRDKLLNHTVQSDSYVTFENITENLSSQHNSLLEVVSNLSKLDDNGPKSLSFSKNVVDLRKFFRKTFGLTWVVFLTLFRYPGFLITILLIPAGCGALSLLVIGSMPLNLPFGVVNYEMLNWTTKCNLSEISENYTDKSAVFNSLSCTYLNELSKDVVVKLISFNNEVEARTHVKTGKLRGYITFSSNFSFHFADLLLTKQYALNDTIEGSRMHVHLDYSEYIARFYLIKALINAYTNFMGIVAENYGVPRKEAQLPLHFRTAILGDNVDNFTAYVMPGVQIFSMFVIDGMISSLILIADRKKGTLSRAIAAGLSFYNVVLAHIVVQGIISIIQLAIWNAVVYFLFHVPILGQTWLYIFLSLLTTACGFSCGILLGILWDHESDILVIGLFLSNTLLLCSGMLWPPETMTKFWKYVTKLVPTALPTQALRSIVLKGNGIEDPVIWFTILITFTWTFVFLALSIILYKLKFNRR